ncbi:MAG: mycothiol system anti-sigma-R factor [Actinomycetota bacterium]
MTDCEQALHEIERYLDGELEGASIADLEVHLEDCSPCSDRAEFQRRLKLVISSKCGQSSAAEIPQTLRVRIRTMIRSQSTDTRE